MKKFFAVLLCFGFSIMPALCIIEDEFVNKTIDNNLKINSYRYEPIVDSFAQNNQRKNVSVKRNIDLNEQIPNTPTEKTYSKKVAIIDEDDFIPVKIQIENYLTTKDEFDEGDIINFKILYDVTINDKFYPKNSIVKARIETISKNKTGGVPADLTIGNFKLDDNFLHGEINKTGANRSLWIYPSMYIGNIFFGAGMLLLFIRGGHAKIKPRQTYTVYAEH